MFGSRHERWRPICRHLDRFGRERDRYRGHTRHDSQAVLIS